MATKTQHRFKKIEGLREKREEQPRCWETRREQHMRHPVGGGPHFTEEVTRERNFEEWVGVCQAESGGSGAGSRKQRRKRLVKGHGRRWRESSALPELRVGEWAAAEMRLLEGQFGARCWGLWAQEKAARFIIFFKEGCYTIDKYLKWWPKGNVVQQKKQWRRHQKIDIPVQGLG